MARSGAGRLSKRILKEEDNNKRIDLGAWALTSRLMERRGKAGCRLLLDRETAKWRPEKGRDETERNKPIVQGPRALQSLFGGPRCLHGRAWPLFGGCHLALGLLEKTVVGRRACKEGIGREAVRDERIKLSLSWKLGDCGGLWPFWRGWGIGLGVAPEGPPRY